jgi:hypothetical protein
MRGAKALLESPVGPVSQQLALPFPLLMAATACGFPAWVRTEFPASN